VPPEERAMDKLNTTTEILTVAEARARLPRVLPVIERIMTITEEAQALHAESLPGKPEPALDPDRRSRLERIETLEAEFRAALRELNELGAVLKDAGRGLIDFYGWIAGEVVHLCYLHGEDTVDFWHGIHDGFGGRQKIAAEDR
jgi:hypothetical protein